VIRASLLHSITSGISWKPTPGAACLQLNRGLGGEGIALDE